MTDKEKLVELITEYHEAWKHGEGDWKRGLADYILADGWAKPPCKVGDMVYVLVDMDGASVEIIKGFVVYHDDDGCKRWKLELLLYDQFGKIIKSVCQDVYEEQFGECIFLSREDAEKALEGMKQ